MYVRKTQASSHRRGWLYRMSLGGTTSRTESSSHSAGPSAGVGASSLQRANDQVTTIAFDLVTGDAKAELHEESSQA